jgi:hypothetical protein
MNKSNVCEAPESILVKIYVLKSDVISAMKWKKLLSKIQIFLITKRLYTGFFSSPGENGQCWFSVVTQKSNLPRVEDYIKGLGINQIFDKRLESMK